MLLLLLLLLLRLYCVKAELTPSPAAGMVQPEFVLSVVCAAGQS
jgi:hypothetical protein